LPWYLYKNFKLDFVVYMVAWILVLFAGVSIGILSAMAIAVLIVLYQLAVPPVHTVGYSVVNNKFVPLSLDNEALIYPGVVIWQFDCPLYYINMQSFGESLVASLKEELREIHCVIVDFTLVSGIDASSVNGILIQHAKIQEQFSCKIYFANVSAEIKAALLGCVEHTIEEDLLFENIEMAIKAAEIEAQAKGEIDMTPVPASSQKRKKDYALERESRDARLISIMGLFARADMSPLDNGAKVTKIGKAIAFKMGQSLADRLGCHTFSIGSTVPADSRCQNTSKLIIDELNYAHQLAGKGLQIKEFSEAVVEAEGGVLSDCIKDITKSVQEGKQEAELAALMSSDDPYLVYQKSFVPGIKAVLLFAQVKTFRQALEKLETGVNEMIEAVRSGNVTLFEQESKESFISRYSKALEDLRKLIAGSTEGGNVKTCSVIFDYLMFDIIENGGELSKLKPDIYSVFTLSRLIHAVRRINKFGFTNSERMLQSSKVVAPILEEMFSKMSDAANKANNGSDDEAAISGSFYFSSSSIADAMNNFVLGSSALSEFFTGEVKARTRKRIGQGYHYLNHLIFELRRTVEETNEKDADENLKQNVKLDVEIYWSPGIEILPPKNDTMAKEVPVVMERIMIIPFDAFEKLMKESKEVSALLTQGKM